MASPLTLNSDQRAAIEHGSGPLLIIAGPGSGKTRVITERIVYLLGGRAEQDGVRRGAPEPVPAESILALTFTKKAAAEMRKRVTDALPDLEKPPTIDTFHAFCLDVLKGYSDQLLLEEVDLWIFLRRRMRALALEHYRKLAEPGAFLHDLNDFFSRCQDELVEPGDYAKYVEGLAAIPLSDPPDPLELAELNRQKELARVFQTCRKLLDDEGCTSFGSLMSRTLKLWNDDRSVLEKLQRRYRYIMVDEFQDSNYAQVELLKRLVAGPYNITAVGDDDQAIYRFRGASSGAFQMFDEAFAGHKTVYLSTNYRSTRRILSASHAVVVKNEGRYQAKPRLTTSNPEGAPVYVVDAPEPLAEAAWVAGEVERLNRLGTRYGDIAVLYRAHNHRGPLVEEFRKRGIPFDIRKQSILRTPMVRDLLAYLQLIHSEHHNLSLTRVLLAPRWRFPEKLAFEARRTAERSRSSLVTAIRAMAGSTFAEEIRATGWSELERLLAGLRGVARVASMPALFERMLKDLGLGSVAAGPDRDRIAAFREFLKEWEKKREDRKLMRLDREPNATALDDFIDYFGYFVDAGGQIEAPEAADGHKKVQMMTVHAAKGLEFPVVFVLSVARQRFPTRQQRPVIEFPDALRKSPPAPEGIHVEEERRLFYVAMTRAEQRLYISGFAKGKSKPSVLIEDVLSDPVVVAKDIERVVAPAIEPAIAEAAMTAPAGAAKVLLSEQASVGSGQGRLFPKDDLAALLHPDLEAFAAQPASSGEPGRPPSLSATGIEEYRTCPLRFKFRHLLKIQTEPHAQLSFGAVMHDSVRHYLELRQAGTPEFEAIEAYFRKRWTESGAGFEDEFHAEQMMQGGLDQLREFVKKQNELPAPQQLRSEQGFQFDLHGITVKGRIDQIQSAQPGAAPTTENPPAAAVKGRGTKKVRENRAPAAGDVELIDYKTGRPKTQKDADTSLQLSVYALAAERALGLRPSRLTFYNLTNNEAVSTDRNARDLDELMGEIAAVAAAIREERFEAAPGFACRYCDFANICPSQEEN